MYNKENPLRATLTRIRCNKQYTHGILQIPDLDFSCNTMEKASPDFFHYANKTMLALPCGLYGISPLWVVDKFTFFVRHLNAGHFLADIRPLPMPTMQKAQCISIGIAHEAYEPLKQCEEVYDELSDAMREAIEEGKFAGFRLKMKEFQLNIKNLESGVRFDWVDDAGMSFDVVKPKEKPNRNFLQENNVFP